MAALLSFASFRWAAAARDNFNNVELWSSLPPPQPFDASVAPSSLVWPPPRHLQVSGTPAPLAASFTITAAPRSGLLSTVQSGVLSAAVEKYSALVQRKVVSSKISPPTASPVTAVHTLIIDVDASESVSDVIGSATKYGYTLTYAGDGVVHATAEGIYGAQYAMESFVQLVSSTDATLAGDAITLRDVPMYAWRGLMLDAGRRFFPMPVVENLLDTMAAAKLNVLHLHASDMCRFGVESKIYPNLTAALTGIHAGFYTQADIAAMQVYAKKLGIRVVPEFDFPGHSRGYIPVSYGADGAEFCEPTASTRSQLYGDPAGKTYKVVHDLMKEMSSLFEDEVFNIGCDETASKGPCTQQSTFGVERKLFTAIASEFGKTPEGWEEAYFDAQAATSDTIINTWSRHTASEVTTLGRKAVESHSGAFYFTGAAPGGPAGWSKCWYDIATKVPAAQLPLVLGGEMSMWTDSYCYIDQCGSSTGRVPTGHALFDPAQDAAFGKSIGGMIWPRGFVGAAAFWNYNNATNPADPAFVASIYKLNDEVKARGGFVCATNCSCNQNTQCGVPYIQTPAPTAGSIATMMPCADAAESSPLDAAIAGQTWSWDATSGAITLKSNSSLCLVSTGSKKYPLVLSAVGCGTPSTAWGRSVTNPAEMIFESTKECLDLKNGGADDVAVGTYECGSGSGLDQQNQHWAFDEASGNIVSIAQGNLWLGQCVTVA